MLEQQGQASDLQDKPWQRGAVLFVQLLDRLAAQLS